MKKIFFFLILFTLFGCIRNTSQKGFIFNEDDFSKINVNLTNKENVISAIGYPNLKSNFNENIWYYYSYKMKEILFFKPNISQQKLLIIEFDPETSIVKNKYVYNIDANDFEINDVKQSNSDEKKNILKDIFNNIGRVKTF